MRRGSECEAVIVAARRSPAVSPVGEPSVAPSARSSFPARGRPIAAAGTLTIALLLAAWGSAAFAAPPRPPGGHLRVHHGGNNRAGYPPLLQTTAVRPDPDRIAGGLSVACTPNPFRSTVRFRFSTRLGESGTVRLFTPDGRQVRELKVAATAGGPHQVAWDGRDQRGRRVPVGVYLYRVDAGSRSARGKIIHVR